jgi:hypothetical protein
MSQMQELRDIANDHERRLQAIEKLITDGQAQDVPEQEPQGPQLTNEDFDAVMTTLTVTQGGPTPVDSNVPPAPPEDSKPADASNPTSTNEADTTNG